MHAEYFYNSVFSIIMARLKASIWFQGVIPLILSAFLVEWKTNTLQCKSLNDLCTFICPSCKIDTQCLLHLFTDSHLCVQADAIQVWVTCINSRIFSQHFAMLLHARS